MTRNRRLVKFIRRQTGSMLIESLVAVLIFSLGILALVGMQASALKASGDAKYRSEACLLANELIGRMWASDRTQATLQTAFSNTGAANLAWAYVGSGATPGTQTAPAAGTVLGTLPNAQVNVVIAPDARTTVPSSLVQITISWLAPNEPVVAGVPPLRHSYVAVAQIGG